MNIKLIRAAAGVRLNKVNKELEANDWQAPKSPFGKRRSHRWQAPKSPLASAEGAKYKSQGQALSEAKCVAPGKRVPKE